MNLKVERETNNTLLAVLYNFNICFPNLRPYTLAGFLVHKGSSREFKYSLRERGSWSSWSCNEIKIIFSKVGGEGGGVEKGKRILITWKHWEQYSIFVDV